MMRTKKIHIILILLIFTITISILGLRFYLTQERQTFERQTQKCNHEKALLRFNCYKKVINNFYNKDVEIYVNEILNKSANLFKDDKYTYAIFGTNCHTFYHALGDFLAEKQVGINLCPDTCTGGCVMGYLKRQAYTANYDSEKIREYYNQCPISQKYTCAHELGHVLNDKYTTPILEVVDQLSPFKLFINKNINISEIRGNESLAFEDCRRFLPKEEQGICFAGIGHNMFLFADFSADGYEKSAKRCRSLTDQGGDECYSFLAYRVGINESASNFVEEKFDEGNKNCEMVVKAIGQSINMDNCYYGLGKGLGLFLQSQFPRIDDTQSPQKTDSLVDSMNKYTTYCTFVETQYIPSCFRGLWDTIFRDYYHLLNLKIEKIEQQISNEIISQD